MRDWQLIWLSVRSYSLSISKAGSRMSEESLAVLAVSLQCGRFPRLLKKTILRERCCIRTTAVEMRLTGFAISEAR